MFPYQLTPPANHLVHRLPSITSSPRAVSNVTSDLTEREHSGTRRWKNWEPTGFLFNDLLAWNENLLSRPERKQVTLAVAEHLEHWLHIASLRLMMHHKGSRVYEATMVEEDQREFPLL
ncbi:unnamed protein product [Pleuronectes platessa]|uniref:Uncharacterized protein n=1 Tax=Pleuronectes platessa TaxID=8262 RepID=A0A9N7TMQ0_PLEPL|nr:unnamed protein product [Pleuronectes platessa]